MLKIFFHAVSELIFYELDVHEHKTGMRRKERILPFYRQKIHGKSRIMFNFDAEDFLANKFFRVNKMLDAYGTVEYDVNGKMVTLLNTYGDEDFTTERFTRKSLYVSVFPICLICDGKIEVGDIVTNRSQLPRKRLSIVNHMIGDIPQKLQSVKFYGKSAFYFHPDKKFVSLRVDEKDYEIVPEKYRHKKVKGWVSGPRVKIPVESVSK